ncbi:hypothetical protein VSVS12_02373 [Vibrio scophthalmi]|nr:hypothetical protein VSVS12_02373 [Vibrio scophthalmi]ANU35734.1 hypothetical protein VSVS05_00602 [Vibrio scophthalmi]
MRETRDEKRKPNIALDAFALSQFSILASRFSKKRADFRQLFFINIKLDSINPRP